jgi:hypothetical protein
MTSIEWLQHKLNNVKPTEFCSIETIKEWVEQAKETLYEDEVKKVIFLARQKGNWQEYQYDYEEIIQLLKQPKKD